MIIHLAGGCFGYFYGGASGTLVVMILGRLIWSCYFSWDVCLLLGRLAERIDGEEL